MKEITLLIILFWTAQSFAQLSSWNAKVMLHSQNGYIDTLWIGCDTSGNEGFQPGLDIIDTVLKQPGGIWGHDSLIPVGECLNLRRDIKNFITGIQKFDIQIVDSDFNQSSVFDYISIDTNDFKFENGEFKITLLFISVIEGGYIMCIDCEEWGLYAAYDTTYAPYWDTDSIGLIFEPALYDCLPINEYKMRLRLEVGFNYYLNIPVEEIKSPEIALFPNPAKNIFYIKSGFPLKKLSIFDQLGRLVESKCFQGTPITYEINAETFYPGVYTVITETQKAKTFTKIVIF